MIFRRGEPGWVFGNTFFTCRAQHPGVTLFTLPLTEAYKPASFAERGVAVPFTTPRLAGARVRAAERTGTEFIVPNPSGGRGVYVLHWGAVRQLCQPTVHDTLLHQKIARLPVMDPPGVRRVARALAAEGVAGHDASHAAAQAAGADRKDQILTNFLLLLTLMEQIEPAGLRVSAGTERTPELDHHARRVITRLATATGRGVALISADLEALSPLFAATGLDAWAPPARLPRLQQRLETNAESLATWAERHLEDEFAPLASVLARSARLSAARAASTLRATRALTQDMTGLLQHWTANPAEIARKTSRPEWVLDGWERFCLLWETAAHVSIQRAVLQEMAQLMPVLPKEAMDWGVEQDDADDPEPALRAARLNEAWRAGGASQGLLARNERFQALIT